MKEGKRENEAKKGMMMRSGEGEAPEQVTWPYLISADLPAALQQASMTWKYSV